MLELAAIFAAPPVAAAIGYGVGRLIGRRMGDPHG